MSPKATIHTFVIKALNISANASTTKSKSVWASLFRINIFPSSVRLKIHSIASFIILSVSICSILTQIHISFETLNNFTELWEKKLLLAIRTRTSLFLAKCISINFTGFSPKIFHLECIHSSVWPENSTYVWEIFHWENQNLSLNDIRISVWNSSESDIEWALAKLVFNELDGIEL